MNFFKNCLLVLISIVITIIFTEIILSFFYPQAKNGSWRVQNEDGIYLNVNKGKAKHEYTGDKEQISVYYKFGRYHNRIILNDKYSFNNNKILILGDSNIFGWLLDDEDLLLTKLQKEYKNYYFINASAGGFSDADMYLYLKRFCNEIKPKFIFFFVEVKRVIKKNNLSLNEKNELVIKKNQINNLKKFLNEKKLYNYLLENSNLFQFIKKIYIITTHSYIDYVDNNNYQKIINIKKIDKAEISENKNIQRFEKEKILLKKLFNNIQDKAEECGSEIIFIDIALESKDVSKTRNYVIDNFYYLFENKEKINFISIYEEMINFRKFNEIYQLEEGHPNAKGNDQIFKYLKNELDIFLLN